MAITDTAAQEILLNHRASAHVPDGARAATITGRAACLIGPRQVEIQEVMFPTPEPGQVRVRLEGCGICASNLPVWEGREWFNYPQPVGAPGHEGWGVVDAIGADVTGLHVCDRVAMLSYHALAQYDVAGEANLIKLPQKLGTSPVPGEPLGCAVNIFRRSDIRPHHTVAVVGIGFLGALLIQLASHLGARVVAISRRDSALEIARNCGAQLVLRSSQADVLRTRIASFTGGSGCDRVLEATGHQEALDLATELVRERGRLIIAGYHQDGPRQVNMQQWNWNGLDVINAHERDSQVYMEGMRLAVEAIVEGRLNPSPLYTHHFALDEIGRAMETARCRPEGFVKPLVWMT